ncbi:MAG: DUF177 domain-containing protein [Bdellovibrionota bacterium]|mgnify:CR=1 FL=1
MKLRWHEIPDFPETELHYTEAETWVRDAVARAEETGQSPQLQQVSALTANKSAPTPAKVDFSVRRVDEVVVVDGRIETNLKLSCSRCANAFNLNVDQSFSTLFSKDPVMAGRSFLEEGSGRRSGQNFGVAKSAPSSTGAGGESMNSNDADITYTDDLVELDEVFAEQMLLQVPFQPLCDENCKGLCSNCGADLNIGRCACAKIKRESPFSALKNLKLNEKIS